MGGAIITKYTHSVRHSEHKYHDQARQGQARPGLIKSFSPGGETVECQSRPRWRGSEVSLPCTAPALRLNFDHQNIREREDDVRDSLVIHLLIQVVPSFRVLDSVKLLESPTPKPPKPCFQLIEVTPDRDTPPGWISRRSVARREPFACESVE